MMSLKQVWFEFHNDGSKFMNKDTLKMEFVKNALLVVDLGHELEGEFRMSFSIPEEILNGLVCYLIIDALL